MATMEEMRVEQEQKKKEAEQEAKRLKEKVLCAVVEVPDAIKRELGVPGFTMKLADLHEFLEGEFRNEITGTFKIQVIERTNKWIENLPEADF